MGAVVICIPPAASGIAPSLHSGNHLGKPNRPRPPPLRPAARRRNTDNAWIETTAYHFHCDTELGALLPLSEGQDSVSRVTWLDINPQSEPRYANLCARPTRPRRPCDARTTPVRRPCDARAT
eukprot:4200422-Prymnesium_polylepis.1